MSAEPIDRQVVTALLRERLDPSLECAGVERGPLGNAQETWFIDARGPAGERHLVLRRSAAAGTLEHTDRGAEFALLRALAARGLPVPEVHWLEDGASTLGRPYFVMERMPGSAVARSAPEERSEIGRELGAWLARLHALEPAELAGVVPRPADAAAATRAELRRWRREYLRARRGPVPLLGALLGWLEAHVPADGAPVRVLWGDPGPHNLLVEGGRITALLDWELAHAGDPLDDLGAALWACLPATLERGDVVAGYEAVAGPVDRERLRYFEALACVTRSVMLVGGVASFLEGSSPPTAAALGLQLLVANLERAADLAGWEAGPARRRAPARLRPDVAETAAGIGRFLREDVLAEVREPRLRRELKTAAALLDTAALRAAREASGHEGDADADELEEAAARAERERSGERAALRARLLADLAGQRVLVRPLDELYGAREGSAE